MGSSISEFGCPMLQIGASIKNQNRMVNSVDPDEMALMSRLMVYTVCKGISELSHQGLHCVQRYH